MQEEVIANVKHIIILLVVIGILLMIAIISTLASEALKGEAVNVTMSGFSIKLEHQPTMTCPSGDWKIEFGAANITDPQRRSLRIIPLIAFAGNQRIGFAKQQSDMDGVPVGGLYRGLITLTEDKGSTSSLLFDKANFEGTIPNTPNLDLRVGFWIWTSYIRGSCVADAVYFNKGLGDTSMFDVINYTSKNCPEAYIGTIYKTIKNECYS